MKSFSITEDGDFYNSIYERIKYESPRVFLSNGSIIKSSDQTEKYNFLDYYDDYCLDSYIDEIKTPIIFCVADGSLLNLESIKYDKETIDYLNSYGIDIFLWEMLHLYQGEKRKISVLNLEDLKFLFNVYPSNIDEDTYRSFELDSVQEFVKHNNLTNVKVHTYEYNTKNFFKSRYSEFKMSSINSVILTLGINNKFTKYEEISFNRETINKKFICLNLRYDFHRQLIASYLIEKQSLITWHNNSHEPNELFPRPTLEYLDKVVPFDFFAWRTSNPDQFNTIVDGNNLLGDNFPIFLPEETHLDEMICGSFVPFPLKSYSECFCSVVNESNFFTPFGGFSEKTLISVLCFKPFILVAPPFSLKYFKEYGFKSFSRWWDESYDQETNHEKRLLKIFKVIDYIDSLTLDELKSIYTDMKSILDHNRNVLSSIKRNGITL